MSTVPVAFEGFGPAKAFGVATPSLLDWYAVYTCPRHEKWVANQLRVRGMESFSPVYRTVHQWKDRKKMVELALFPSYAFVRIDPVERVRVLQVPGVVQLVSFGGKPAPLPTTAMDA